MGQGPSSLHTEAGHKEEANGTSKGADWRSARARDLDKLGGANRAPVRRGESMKKRLEWLQDAVASQGDEIEKALSKDPFAGRHEIMAQEVRKAINNANLPANKTNGLKLTVKDWQRANHTELRARIVNGRKTESDTGAIQKTRAESRGGPRSRWGGTSLADLEEQQVAEQAPAIDKTAMRTRARDYYLNMQIAKGKKVQEAYSPKPPTAASGEDHANWRGRVLQAKKTAWRALNTAIAFQGGAHNRPRGPARLDSFSYFIASQLADDLGKFTQEADHVVSTHQSLQDAQEVVQKLQHRPSVPFLLDTTVVAAPTSASAPVTPTQSPYAPHKPTIAKTTSSAFKPGRGKALSFSPSKQATPTASTSSPAKTQGAAADPPADNEANPPLSTSGRKSVTLAKPAPDGLNVARSPSIRVKGLNGVGRASMAVRTSTEPAEDVLAAARKVVELEAQLDQNRKMMSLHVHRANSRWAEHQAWEPAHVTHLSKLAVEASGGQALQFRNAALDALRAGHIAIQVFIGEDVVSLSSAHAAYDLWELDPWFALRMLLPAKAEGVDALSGVNLGPRMLLGLAAAVESLAGAEAVSKLHVILHCSEAQEPQILADLANKHHCGLNPDNVLLVPQRYFHGYMWDAAQERFVSAREKLRSLKSFARSSKSSRSRRSSHSRSITGEGGVSLGRSMSRSLSRAASKARRGYLTGSTQLGGSGYSMMQLGWPGEAHLVSKDGTATPIQGTALEYLAEHGVRWMMTRRLRDLTLFDPAASLDLDSLAACFWLHESQGATACVWVDMIASVQAAAAGLQGVVLGHKAHTGDGRLSGSGASKPQASGLVGSLMASRHASAPGIIPDSGKDMAGKALPHGPPPLPVVDLEATSLVSPKLAGLLGEIKARVKGAGLPASNKRYFWRLAELTAALCQPGVMRPVLSVRNTQTFVSFDAAQLTGSPALHCAAMCAGPRNTVRNLSSAQDADALLQVIKAQDASGTFRRLLATSTRPRSNPGDGQPSLVSASEDLLGDPEALKARDWTGKRVVVLVKDTKATMHALELALALIRPGRDMMLLVAVASSNLGGEAAARNVLAKYLAVAKQSAVDCAAEVLPKDGQPLLELIEEYALDAEADLVCMGSRGQHSGGAQAIGSVAWGLMKVMPCPILVVKESAQFAKIEWEKDPVKLMLPVDHTSRGLLRWAGKFLLQSQRQDKVLLAKCGAAVDNPSGTKAKQDAVMSKRMLDNYADIAFSFHLDNTRRQLEGSYETAGVQWADAEKTHIMAIQAPPGRALQESVLKLLTATRSALLLYKGGAHDPV